MLRKAWERVHQLVALVPVIIGLFSEWRGCCQVALSTPGWAPEQVWIFAGVIQAVLSLQSWSQTVLAYLYPEFTLLPCGYQGVS